jgi:hypothetical protein
MELPTRKVAGSPTRVNMPAELLMMAVRIKGADEIDPAGPGRPPG